MCKKYYNKCSNDHHGHQYAYEREQSLLVNHIASVFKLIDHPHNCGINWDENIWKMLKKLLFYCFKRFSFKIRP